mmetsp:Transcript_1373/g.2565  ORF Transcript_1373/g.2565 Transcript_1373/m.2565 type:complete len:569 (+) Transcript_1373:45-1751(+)
MAPTPLMVRSPLAGSPRALACRGRGAPPPPVRTPLRCAEESGSLAEHASPGRRRGVEAKSGGKGRQQPSLSSRSLSTSAAAAAARGRPSSTPAARGQERLRQRSASSDCASCPSTPSRPARKQVSGTGSPLSDRSPEISSEALHGSSGQHWREELRSQARPSARSTSPGERQSVRRQASLPARDAAAAPAPASPGERPFVRRQASQPSRDAIAALASEYLSVCGNYEDHLRELKTMCTAINRSSSACATPRQAEVGSPTASTPPYPSAARSRPSTQAEGRKSRGPPQHESSPVPATPKQAWAGTATAPTRPAPSAGRSRSSSQALGSPRKAACPRAVSEDRCGLAGRHRLARRSPVKHVTSPDASGPSTAVDELVASLLVQGLLSRSPRPWDEEPNAKPDDLAHVRELFATGVQSAPVLRVFRVENAAPSGVYEAVRKTMEVQEERVLWHGTSADSVHNIISNGFNRAYCGRHGTKLGHGTYFSASPEYSVRFCGRKASRRLMLLAKVLTGVSVKGNAELIEPPYRDAERLKRYDSTVDDIESPGIFCVFRDFQALPLYLVEFAAQAS